MSIELVKFDIAEHLANREAIADYLEACLDEGGIPLFLKGIGHAARASGMKAIADTAGVTRASLYKSLSESGTPALATIDKVMNQLGLKFSITAIKPSIKAGRTYAGGAVSGQKCFRVSEPEFVNPVGKRAAKSAKKVVAKKQAEAGKKPSRAPAKRA